MTWDFQDFRLRLDDAITYHGSEAAWRIAGQALEAARSTESLGEMMYFAAQLAMLEEDYEQAVRYLRNAITANPRDGAAYNDLALCKAEAGRLDEALALFDKGISVEPDFATIHHNKGWLLSKMGYYRKAIVFFQEALRLDPGRAVTYENLADTYAHLHQFELAITACRKALEVLKPGCPDIRQQLEDKLDELQS